MDNLGMTDARRAAIRALDASPEHEAALPVLRPWAESGTDAQVAHVIARLRFPVRLAPIEPEPIPSQPPGILTRAVSFAGAVVAHVAAGMPEVDDAAHAARLAICGGCEHFDAPNVACLKCGCNTNLKARWADQHCPIGKW